MVINLVGLVCGSNTIVPTVNHPAKREELRKTPEMVRTHSLRSEHTEHPEHPEHSLASCRQAAREHQPLYTTMQRVP